jgi:hypothetical protein
MASQDRIQLFNSLNHLTPQDLNKLIFALQPPAGVMPGDNAPRGDKVAALLNWAESTTGEGLAVIQEMLNNLDSLPPPGKTQKAIGPNPYKGLLAFEEGDSDRYFGRSEEIQTLWSLCRAMHRAEGKTRLLPIYGPSGSGKSSLAKAGLLAELRRRPLPGCDRLRIAAMVPGTQPLQALANTLARLADGQDALPVKKIREFTEELGIKTFSGDYDGLQRIASLLPDIATAPLILLVDQFEEIYSLCNDPEVRNQFIANLLYAAQDRSQYVSVLLTCRSDFLAETQQYPELNKLFSTQGFLVPIMQPEGLAEAITEPAKQAGYPFDPATVKLLVEQCRGHQGALPLLQFALQRIWEGLQQGYEPLETLDNIGGVGGALADEAQKLYDSLSADEQKIAPRIFVALVQLDETSGVTRRRARKAELITSDDDIPQVDAIIERFADPGVRFLVTSFTEEDGEIIEVAHEALIQSWGQLQVWIDECREALRQKRKIEQAAQEWKKQGHDPGYLLQGRQLSDARAFLKSQEQNSDTVLSRLANSFIDKSLQKRRRAVLKYVATFSIFPLLGTLTAMHFYILGRANTVLWDEGCSTNPDIGFLIWYVILVGQKNNLESMNACEEDLGSIDLSGAELVKANFRGTVFSKASFSYSQLIEADFRKSILWDVDFTEANLREAKFNDSFLYETDLRNARNFTKKQAEQALLCKTLLPQEFNLESDRDCQEYGF